MAKALVITGASRGIGAATALLAARCGWSVVVNFARREADAKSVVQAIIESGGEAIAVSADVSDEGEVQYLFDAAEDTFGKVRGLVNNAGLLQPASRFTDITLARWTAIFATNSTGAFLCSREAARRMSFSLGGSGGSIVNLSSMASVLGAPSDAVDYACSKAAIDLLTIGLGKELAAEGIRVNAVRPGLIDTDMLAQSGDGNRARTMLPTVPLGRIGTCDEVAAAIVWLLSEQASYCAGTTITVSGGR